MKRVLFIILAIVLPIIAYTQTRNVLFNIRPSSVADTSKFISIGKKLDRVGGGTTETPPQIETIIPDRIERYAEVVKRYGRWEGYGRKLTEEQASHLTYYYRLTYVAGAKYPSQMEALDGYHKLTTGHGIGTYLANQNDNNDKTVDKAWQKKLGTVCQWDFIYNKKGDIAVERAYDGDGNLVYAYHPVKIGNRVAGTFTDAWGMPARLRQDSCAQVVFVSYDENGFESLHEFYDEQGYRQKNKDGAYMVRIQNAKDGHALSKASCSITGELMMDAFGNCGMLAEYDADGKEISETNMDNHWNPIRIESGIDTFYYNMIKRNYDYDIYGRCTKMWFSDLENQPDTNLVGIHSMEMGYNSRGQRTSFAYKDLEGNYKINPYDGQSHWENVFDEKTGRILSTTCYGDAQKLDSLGYSREIRYVYNKFGDEIENVSYGFDGDSVKTVFFVRTKEGGLRKVSKNDVKPQNHIEKRTFSKDNMIVTIEYDEKGRRILWEYTDLNGYPSAPYGYYQDIDTYVRIGDTIEIETEYYTDTLGNVMLLPGNSWAINRIISHFNNGKLTFMDIFNYDEDQTVISSWRKLYDEDGSFKRQMTLNKFGVPSRTAVDDVVYYQCGIENDIKGEHTASIMSYNEFDEPSYMESWDGISHYWNFVDNSRTYYDEHGNPIKDMKTLMDTLSAVVCVVVTDSAGYRNQLKDGDVIIKYGDWVSNMKLQKYENHDLFCFELIDKATSEKDVLVLRHYPEQNKSEVLSIHLPVGTIQELGFFPQIIYYTQKEKQRYEQALHTYLTNNDLASLDGYSAIQGTHHVVIRKPKRYNGDVPTMGDFHPLVFNPAVVLSMAKYEIRDGEVIADEYWNLGMGTDTLVTILSLNNDEKQKYYISVSNDLENTLDGFEYYDNSHSWSGGLWLDDTRYARVMAIQNDFMNRIGASFNPKYRAKNAMVEDVSTKMISPSKFFKEVKKMEGTAYTNNAIALYNNDSLCLPQCFNGMEMIYVGKAQTPEVYAKIRSMIPSIDNSKYTCLPNFYNGDLALVMQKEAGYFSELFFVICFNSNIRIFQHSGRFSVEDILSMQRLFGKEEPKWLGIGIDVQDMVLIRVETDGAMRDAGFEGTFALVQCNNWMVGQDYDALRYELGDSRDKEHHMLFIPIDSETGQLNGALIEMTFAPGLLGARFFDQVVPIETYLKAMGFLNSK